MSCAKADIRPTYIEGHPYYTIPDFSAKTGKSVQSIYKLIRKGNAIRKLATYDALGKQLIPAEELTRFPFTGPGRYPTKEVYHYTALGQMFPCDECALNGYSSKNSCQQKDTL